MPLAYPGGEKWQGHGQEEEHRWEEHPPPLIPKQGVDRFDLPDYGQAKKRRPEDGKMLAQIEQEAWEPLELEPIQPALRRALGEEIEEVLAELVDIDCLKVV